ncbi:MAG: GntR family transcriptional regulator [Planctomycetes bacterium]|nr:GntR family transcriptional regulator [Planctomycetota bacterium]
MAAIGKRNLLGVVRETNSGLYLDGEELGEILLPGRYVPRHLAAGEKLDVFIYRDSEDRLVATTEKPLAEVGEFACLKVKEINPQIGAFLEWGLAKDLLLPFNEQGGPVQIGQRIAVAVCVDPETDRIMASARLNRHLSRDEPAYAPNQPVRILITGETPLGYNAIVENAHRGLLYYSNLPAPLTIGQRMFAFIRLVRPDGKIDLSIDAAGYERVEPLTELIIEALRHAGGRLNCDDDSSPEEIREQFGVSKKAFKQALGKLFRERRIAFEKPGIQLVDAPAS